MCLKFPCDFGILVCILTKREILVPNPRFLWINLSSIFHYRLFEFSSNIFPKFQLVGQSIIIIIISQPSFHSSFVLNFSSFEVFIFNNCFL